jgi:hypothetical protein
MLGYVLPNLISRKATQHAASVLYTVFGLRLLWIAWHSKPQETNQARAPPGPQPLLMTSRIRRILLVECVRQPAGSDVSSIMHAQSAGAPHLTMHPP